MRLDPDEVLDSTTICRFRQSLVERNILKRLLDKLNHQLERQGLLVREGTIVDASVVSSARRPIKVLDVLAVRGLSDGIMYKAARNRELTLAEKAANRQVSSVRSKVERAFGTLKRGYGFFRARYLGLAKSNWSSCSMPWPST